jgi:epsin
VIKYAKENLYVVKTLKDFIYVDEDGKDQGINIRQKSQEITTLIMDENRLREERSARKQMKNRFDSPTASSPSYDYSYSGQSSSRSKYEQHRLEEQEREDLEKAIEESKRTAAEYEKRMKQKEPVAVNIQHQSQQQQAPMIDLLGSPVNNSQNSNFNNDPFGFSNSNNNFGNNNFGNNNFGNNNFSNFNNGSFNNNVFGGMGNSNGQFDNSNNNFDPFGTGAPQTIQSSSFVQPIFANPVMDMGNTPKPLPFTNQDPNAAMANVARNATQIDPFAALATDRSKQFQIEDKPAQNQIGWTDSVRKEQAYNHRQHQGIQIRLVKW